MGQANLPQYKYFHNTRTSIQYNSWLYNLVIQSHDLTSSTPWNLQVSPANSGSWADTHVQHTGLGTQLCVPLVVDKFHMVISMLPNEGFFYLLILSGHLELHNECTDLLTAFLGVVDVAQFNAVNIKYLLCFRIWWHQDRKWFLS